MGIMGTGLFAGYAILKDEKARRIGNSIAIADQYVRIWRELYQHPELGRVLNAGANPEKEPVSDQEQLFVNMLINHLSIVFRAGKQREFVDIEGLDKDVRNFFRLPIPNTVWRDARPLQDKDFAAFVEMCLQ